MQQRIACLFITKSRAPVETLAEACYRFSPQIAVRRSPEGSAIFLEIGACRNLYSEHSLLLRLGVLAQRFGSNANVGFADDVCSALAFARYGATHRSRLPLEALHFYINPFHHDDETHRKVARMISTLKMLGIDDLDGFSNLPTETLASRFGSEAVDLSLSLRQEMPIAWPRFTPPEKVSERAELHDLSEYPACSDLEPLLFILKNLADRSMARLRARGLRSATIEIILELEKGRRDWLIDLPIPQGSTAGLIPILRERLSFDLQREPLTHQVIAIEMTILETAPGHRAQRDLFSAEEDEAETWDALVGRLCQKVGKDNAFCATPVDRYLPERAWARAMEALDQLPTDIPPRPARVLKRPQPLRKDGDALIGQKKAWRVSEWHGPERIAVEWWMDPQLAGFNRDYYRIVTASGEQLWIFAIPSKEGFYLHGYFD